MFEPNGSITGSVDGSGQTFDFNFGPQSTAGLGTEFGLFQGFPDGRTSTFIYPTIDNLSIVSAPEPSEWSMLLLGMFGIGAVIRICRRKRDAAPMSQTRASIGGDCEGHLHLTEPQNLWMRVQASSSKALEVA
jgi:hypothetical protein